MTRFEQLAHTHSDLCRINEIARSASGLPVYALRLGTGARRVAILSGMHGCEPSGPRGLLAFLDALLSRSAPFEATVDPSILQSATLVVIPLLNPGGAARFAMHFPGSWHGTQLQGWTEANRQRFFAEGNEPLHFFFSTWVKQPPMHFTPDQIAQWEAGGNVLGSSLTDGGLDMWFDWAETHGDETRAAKELLGGFRPHVVADFHNFMFPTEVFAPTVYSQGALAWLEESLAGAIQEAWRARRLPFRDRPPRPYPKPAEPYYEDAWFHKLGAATLIIEFNGGMPATEGAECEALPGERPLTRRESLESAFVAATALARRAAETS